MDETTLKIAMAGFFHDIGKFADKEMLEVTEKYINDNSSYLPFKNGTFSHYHALYTAAFIEYNREELPPQLNDKWGEGEAFINIAAGHHNPETPLQYIVTEADWLTSGMDRAKFADDENREIPYRDYRKTRLLTLFEQLKRNDRDVPDKFSFVYPLRSLSPSSIFPKEKRPVTDTDSREEYRALFEEFIEHLRGLRHRLENLPLWFEHFESLVMTYASSIPSARAGDVLPDVSLYDHLRVTSAFATALYLYHRDTDSLQIEAIKGRDEQKFLLIGGNFFGIQDFIFSGYGDTRKYRSKLLRGRSFYVSLLSEMAAHMLCEEIGLPSISVILNAAGRFTILAPNTSRTWDAIKKTKERINQWLMEISYGEIAIGFSTIKASPKDFIPPLFARLWERFGTISEEAKFSKIDMERYGGIVSGYQFDKTLERPMCPLCGKRPAVRETRCLPSDQADPVCLLCADHIFLGSRLVKQSRIIVGKKDAGPWKKSNSLMEPLFGQFQLCFTDKDADYKFDETGDIIKFWDMGEISHISETSLHTDVTWKFLNGYVPRYTEDDIKDKSTGETDKDDQEEAIRPGDPKTLNHIAASALNPMGDGKYSGIEALGILKADVDFLGMLMGTGISEDRFTVSRLASLSRQLNLYFALYLPHLLFSEKRFQDIYTVFAGGDDLFLIGPWNKIYELSMVLRETFESYVCKNPHIHFSAGISLKKPHTPIDVMAKSAEDALERSKKDRNRLTMFDQTVQWDQMEDMEAIRNRLEEWIDEGLLNNSMLYRLNGFIDMASRAKKFSSCREVSYRDMSCLKWRALLSYSADRNIGKNIQDKKRRSEKVTEIIGTLTKWLEEEGGNLKIPLWNILYNMR